MNYTIKQLGAMAGVSTRTLRYYDQIGLLKPERINASGYRIYGQKQVDLLQQILFYRELGFSLKKIRQITGTPGYDAIRALTEQRQKLIEKAANLRQLIATIEQTLAYRKGKREMNDEEKFAGFKKEAIARNEALYGKEIREKYGEEEVERSNRQFAGLSREQYAESEQIHKQLLASLQAELARDADPAGKDAQKAVALHKKWLSFFQPACTREMHVGLAKMYVADPRFKSFYDKRAGEGAAVLLRDAILVYNGMKS
ncbi:MAG: MerR family transcriptional regulator [Sporolactobacillus sp.]|jgi:DNA-binding transcriptional MerR regulator|nr:MerR family transcriptional regulator [Sporolactobacillus sp.]